MNKDLEYNPILNTDSYKASHYLQYPPKTQFVYSYIEARGSIDKLPARLVAQLADYMPQESLAKLIENTTSVPFDNCVFFGLQPILLKYMSTPITMEMIDYAEREWTAHGEPFNRAGWEYIVNVHNGKLPLRIRAVKEGTVLPLRNALVTVENTDPECFWLTSYVEPMLLRVWYGITVATLSWTIKQIIAAYMKKSCDNLDGLAFKLHDFGARGVSSFESAGIGGAAHLLNFMGTDTMTGIQFLRQFYNTFDMPGYSIPAGEHSSFTSWERDNEANAYRNMIVQFGTPGNLFACVSDSYDIFNAVDNIWGKELKDELLASGATCVIRPDSGEPKDIVLKVVQLLDKNFGSTINSKGYKVLHPSVRVIQGDGINLQTVSEIYDNLLNHGYSADNVALGMGGGLLQMVNRDTLQFAMKTCAATIDGRIVEVYKDPITDSGKRSKRGRQTLVMTKDGKFLTVQVDGPNFHSNINSGVWTDILEDVYLDGDVKADTNLPAMRANSNAHHIERVVTAGI